MWMMMGYNEPHDQHPYPLKNINTNNGSRRPLFKPLTPPPPPTSTAVSSSSSSTAFFSDHHHHLTRQNKIESSPDEQQMQVVVSSSRWNPTPEQLQTLEELYRRGTRTPSADEIQHITTQLRRYGNIQGKNVFYWFQNHKARERQKRRRRLLNHNHNPPTTFINNNLLDHSSVQHQHQLSEVEETRNWAIPTLSDSEKNVVRERKGQTESQMTKTDEAGMISIEQQGNDHELLFLHQRRRNIIWDHMMQCLSSSSSSSSSSYNSNHITRDPATLTTTITTTTSASNILPTRMVSSHTQRQHPHEVDSCETLELFPVNRYGHGKEQPEKCFVPMGDVSLGSRQFIEFLPLKN